MHLGLADAVTILLGGLGIVGVLAAAAAVARASSIKANLELLRGEVADLTASNARLDGENTKMTQELQVLRDLVTSRTDVAELAKEIRAMVTTIHDGYVVLATATLPPAPSTTLPAVIQPPPSLGGPAPTTTPSVTTAMTGTGPPGPPGAQGLPGPQGRPSAAPVTPAPTTTGPPPTTTSPPPAQATTTTAHCHAPPSTVHPTSTMRPCLPH